MTLSSKANLLAPDMIEGLGRNNSYSRDQNPIGLPDGKSLLDDTNVRLLGELSVDPRASAAELARRVGMSAPAVRERLARLEEAGVIRGYRLDIDPAAIGLPVAALGPDPPRPRAASQDRRAGRTHPSGQRMPPHLRRGLLPAQGPRSRHRGPRGGPRPVPAVRPDHQLVRRVHTGAATQPSRTTLTGPRALIPHPHQVSDRQPPGACNGRRRRRRTPGRRGRVPVPG